MIRVSQVFNEVNGPFITSLRSLNGKSYCRPRHCIIILSFPLRIISGLPIVSTSVPELKKGVLQ